MTTKEALSAVLAFVRDAAGVPCCVGHVHTNLNTSPAACPCMPCYARAALDAWEKRGPLRDDASLYDECFEAARLCRDGYPVRAILGCLDRELFGRTPQPTEKP